MRSDLPAEGIPKMFIEPTKTYVSLSGDGTSKQFPGGTAFWSLPIQELEVKLLTGVAKYAISDFARRRALRSCRLELTSRPVQNEGFVR
jgi:hypothetical protein